MKKKFYFTFKWPIYVLAAVINALIITVFVLNVLKLASVGDFRTTNLPLDVTALLMSILLFGLVNSVIFLSGYTIKEQTFTYNLGIMRFNISYDDIVVIREEKTSHAMVLNYKKYARREDGTTVVAPEGLVINIANGKKEEFVSTLRDKNKKIIYEVIDKNLENQR